MSDLLIAVAIELTERGWISDSIVRRLIRRLLDDRLQSVHEKCNTHDATRKFAERMRNTNMLVAAQEANHQHYEVPAEFFRLVLGSHLKYSCGYWETATSTLDEAESAMLKLTCQRAEIEDGMRILELGCGWGSLCLWIAERYPSAQIVAVSNSHGQRQFIETQCREKNLTNLKVITANVAKFEPDGVFDRVVSVEMFEHIRNHSVLLQRIARWLASTGKLFIHVFCHHDYPYCFEVKSRRDWMARHFFTGGIMPSLDLFGKYDEDLQIESQWIVNGVHYSRTCEAWLQKLDARKPELTAIFTKDQSNAEAKVLLQRWRMFFMACSELFQYNKGNDWFIAHYLLSHAQANSSNQHRTPLKTPFKVT